MENQILPPLVMKPEEKAAMLKIIVAGSDVLRKHHEKVKKNKGFIAEVYKQSLGGFREALFAKMDANSTPPVRLYGTSVGKKDLEKIVATRNLEHQVMRVFSRLIAKYARKFNKKYTNLEFSDFYSSGIVGTIKAIYGYDPQSENNNKAQFITYLAWAIKHEMSHFVRTQIRSVGERQSGKRIFDLYKKFAHEKNGPTTLDEAALSLKLNKLEQRRLLSIGTSSHNFTDMDGSFNKSNGEERTQFSDYVTEPMKLKLDSDQIEAIKRANLSPEEIAIVTAAMTDGYGWKTRALDGFINPKTGKPYSRQAVAFMIDRIKTKIQKAYSKNESYSDAA